MCQNCVSSRIKRFSVIRCVSCSDRKREGVCNQMWGQSLGTRRCFHYERSLPWKRECVKNVFLCVSYTFNFPKLNSFFPAQGRSLVFFHYKAHPNSPWWYRIFKRSNQREILDHRSLLNLHVPAWTNAKSDTVMCLPWEITSKQGQKLLGRSVDEKRLENDECILKCKNHRQKSIKIS